MNYLETTTNTDIGAAAQVYTPLPALLRPWKQDVAMVKQRRPGKVTVPWWCPARRYSEVSELPLFAIVKVLHTGKHQVPAQTVLESNKCDAKHTFSGDTTFPFPGNTHARC